MQEHYLDSENLKPRAAAPLAPYLKESSPARNTADRHIVAWIGKADGMSVRQLLSFWRCSVHFRVVCNRISMGHTILQPTASPVEEVVYCPSFSGDPARWRCCDVGSSTSNFRLKHLRDDVDKHTGSCRCRRRRKQPQVTSFQQNEVEVDVECVQKFRCKCFVGEFRAAYGWLLLY